MDVNFLISLSVIVSGVFSVLCYFPTPGKYLVPNLHLKDASKNQLLAMLVTGVVGMLVGLYSILVNPIFFPNAT